MIPRSLVLFLLVGCGGGDVSVTKQTIDDDSDGYSADVDCDDAHASVNPDATEICDGLDNDCDGAVDDDASDAVAWFADDDGDGYGGEGDVSCDPPTGAVDEGGDCEDADAAIHPDADEHCDGIDEDCDGAVDEDAVDAVAWYDDADGDGYGAGTGTVTCDPEAGQAAQDGDCDDAVAAVHPDAPEADCADPTDYNCDGSVGWADADGDGVAACEECNDGDATAYPGAPEACDGVDDDCDGAIDEGLTELYYADLDGDGHGDPATAVEGCGPPTGYVADATDCDDHDAGVAPGLPEVCDGVDQDCDGLVDEDATDAAVWYADDDGDGHGSDSTVVAACEAPAGYAATDDDCDDADATVFPGATEWCDGIDHDCDGAVDEDGSADAGAWYGDADADGYGGGAAVTACVAPAGYVATRTDCDDGDAAVNPGATEVCDAANVDEDCDGAADDATAAGQSPWYRDADADGYGGSVSTTACDAPAGYVATSTDCNDSVAAIHPGATEVCDAANLDEDCDGAADDADAAAAGKTRWYADTDGDTFGAAASPTTACDAPAGHVADATDCDDTDAAVNPAAVEVCDAANVDEDCDGAADDATAAGQSTWYADADSDGYGGTTTTAACDRPAGYLSTSTDCNDAVAAIHPGATEVCDAANVDEDCDGAADDADASATGKTTGYRDADADGYGGSTSTAACDLPAGYVATSTDCNDAAAAINPAATEVCDAANVDEDCDGAADDADASATGKSSWYRDADTDGYGGSTASSACDAPSGYVATSTDCNDAAAAINPAAAEICDAANVDEDCDGAADDADASVTGKTTGYRDADSDGYGGTTSATACDLPAGYLSTSTDCNDAVAAIHPGATEVCDTANVDEDCDGAADDADASATGKTTAYRDADGDGYGGPTSASACDFGAGYVATSTDCNDAVAAISPAATEVCDAANVDEDCDGAADDADASATGKSSWYRDADTDGYGSSTASSACDAPSGYVATSTDCNDAAAAINPAAAEICDAANVDEDCDGAADDADASVTGRTTWYADADADGYAGAASTSRCDSPSGYLATSTDCDDAVAAVNPGAIEVCDAADTDEDCDGLIDDEDPSVDPTTLVDAWEDLDGDGYGDPSAPILACDLGASLGAADNGDDCDDTDATMNPGEAEVEDGVDNDCDGLVDNTGAWHEEVLESNAYWQLDSDISDDDRFALAYGTWSSGYVRVRWGSTADGWTYSTVNAANSVSPSVALGPDGYPYVLWRDQANQDVWEGRYTDSSWSTSAIDYSAGAHGPQYYITALDVLPDGTIHSYYWDESAGVGYHRTGTWGAMTTAWTDAVDPLGVSQAIDPITGNVAFAWYYTSNYSLGFQLRDSTGAGIDSEAIGYGGYSTRAIGCGVELAYDDDGNLYGVWQDLIAGTVKFGTYDATTESWSSVSVFSPPGYCASDIDLTMDHAGNAHLVYVVSYGSTYYPIYYYTNASGSWVRQQLATSADHPTFAEVQVDSYDNVHIFGILNASKELVHYYVY